MKFWCHKKDICLLQNNDSHKSSKVGTFQIINSEKILLSYYSQNDKIKMHLSYTQQESSIYLELTQVDKNDLKINVLSIFGFYPRFYLSKENNITFSLSNCR